MKFLFFIIIQVFLCSLANADVFDTTTLQGNSNRQAGILINVWRGADSGLNLFKIKRKNYVKDEVIYVSAAAIRPPRDILGETTPMYVVAVVNGTAYIKNANGQWLRWDGRLQAFELQESNTLHLVNLIDGLTGLTGTIDIYFGFGTKTGDVIYNKKPLTIQISEGYEHILTVGENGTYAGCDGIKTALNIAQDSTEIRIQQGVYPCSGIKIASSKNFNKYGIKISGGWDNNFQLQSNDPSLTILDGANNEGKYVLLVENHGAISVEMLLFQNANTIGSGGATAIRGGGITSGGNKVYINKCHFRKNGRVGEFSGGHGGGAIYSVNTIENSLFTDNKASSGGAVSFVTLISNSVFINNHAFEGGAVSLSDNIINSVFISNTSDGDAGAVEGGGVILNSTFFNNSAKNSGGAISSNSVNIQNSIFYENIADGQPSDLDSSGGGITIDYSLFNHLSGAADVGIHNITGDPLFLDSANGDYSLQTGSKAINTGDKNVLRNEFSYLFPRIGFNNPVDLDNKPRLQGSSIDMGAFENR